MSMFYLESDAYSGDLECPCCHTSFAVGWYTEYGEPITGQHDVDCPSCGYELIMRVGSTIEIDAIPRSNDG